MCGSCSGGAVWGVIFWLLYVIVLVVALYYLFRNDLKEGNEAWISIVKGIVVVVFLSIILGLVFWGGLNTYAVPTY